MCRKAGNFKDRTGIYLQSLNKQGRSTKAATDDLINRMYDGSKDLLIASLLGSQEITPDKIAKLKKMAEDLK